MRKVVSRTTAALSILFVLTVVCEPSTAATFVCGVPKGATTNYSFGQTGSTITSWKFVVTDVSGTLVTYNFTEYYADNTVATHHEDNDNLTIQQNTHPTPQWPLMFYIAANLANDPVWYGSPIRINETINNYVIAGAGRKANHINVTSTYGDISVDSYYDQSTGVLLRYRYRMESFSAARWWENFTLTSTSLWEPGTNIVTAAVVVGGVAIIAVAAAILLLRRRK